MSTENEQHKLQQMPTGTLLRRLSALQLGDNNIKSIEACERELNNRFAAFDSQYVEDLRQMAIKDYEEKKT